MVSKVHHWPHHWGTGCTDVLFTWLHFLICLAAVDRGVAGGRVRLHRHLIEIRDPGGGIDELGVDSPPPDVLTSLESARVRC
jgi:hypothetical protein